MSLMDDIRKMRETGLMANGQPLPTPTQGAYVPQQFGGESDNGTWMQPVWDPTAGGSVQMPQTAPKLPPQLAQQAPNAADFTNRQSPELAQLQALLAQRQAGQQLPQQAQAQQQLRGRLSLTPFVTKQMLYLKTQTPNGSNKLRVLPQGQYRVVNCI